MLTAPRDPALVASSARLVGLPDDAVTAMVARAARATDDDPYADRLLRALAAVPDARARHARRGVPDDVSLATLRDLSRWCAHTQRHLGLPGLCADASAWSREYLHGDLLRLGDCQLAPSRFDAPLVALRHRETGAITALALPLHRDAHAVTGHPIDPVTGAVLPEPVTLSDARWSVELSPGDPTLSLHLPADAPITLRGVLDAIALAHRTFTESPRPKAVWGVAWLLDPQVGALLPRHEGVRDLRRVCHLFPSTMPEAKTIRRLFGPEATRETVRALPRAAMTSLQRDVAALLDDPRRSLAARGGFTLTAELEALRGEASP